MASDDWGMTTGEELAEQGPTRHRVVAGSHERPDGAECHCGFAWDNWNGHCTAPGQAHVAARVAAASRVSLWLDDDIMLRIPDTEWGRALYADLRLLVSGGIGRPSGANDGE